MIYFVQSDLDGEIKIGFTIYVPHRFQQLQLHHSKPLRLLATVSGEMRDEKLLHLIFSEARVRGEWYRPTPPLLAFIDHVNQTGTLWPEAQPTEDLLEVEKLRNYRAETPADKDVPRVGRWVSFREATAYLGINDGTLRKRLLEGLIEGKKIHGPNGPEWRICLPGAAAESTECASEDPCSTPPIETAWLPHHPEVTPLSSEPPPPGPVVAPIDLLVLWREHQAASYRIGYLEAQLAGLPALTEGASAAAARAVELEAQAQDAERELLRAASLHAAERRRWRAVAAGALLLAVLTAVLGGLLLTRRPAGAAAGSPAPGVAGARSPAASARPSNYGKAGTNF